MQSLKVYLVGSLLLTNYRRTFEDKISARDFLSESQALLCKCQFAQKHGQRPLETSTIASLPSLRMLAGPPSRWLISQFLSLSSFAKKIDRKYSKQGTEIGKMSAVERSILAKSQLLHFSNKVFRL